MRCVSLISTELDRFIQQAVMQVLQRQGPDASDHSYGFSRDGRLIKRCTGAGISPKVTAGASISTWRNFSIGQSRQTDGSNRQTDRGQAVVETHPGILNAVVMENCWSVRCRDPQTTATAQQPRTDEPTGAPGPSPFIRGRLYYLCSQRQVHPVMRHYTRPSRKSSSR
jgi:hypothetical protein